MTLITGSDGFIGRATFELLRRERARPIVQHIGFDLMGLCDIRDKQLLDRWVGEDLPGRILHLAAIARFQDADRDPILAYQTNVVGTQNVIDVAAKYHIPVVYASTGSAIMPLDGYEPPFDETIPARGNSVYGCTKAIGEHIVRQHTPHIILRYAHIYGKEKRHHGLVGGFVERIERGLQPRLYGGQQTNDFIYVKDVARANVLALNAPWDKWNQTYNIGTGVELTAEEAGQAVIDAMGKKVEMERVEARIVDPQRFALDVSKAREWLGFEAEYGFADGLADMMEES
jgi:UDP-glucose 4-epimerase